MGSGKHLIDNVDTLIVTALRGLARCNPRLVLDVTQKITYLPPSSARVHLLSGGGSGHEPASAGFVGSNMLDCAVSGDIFASPSASAVSAGITNLGNNPVLVIVLNYTGDRLHFGIAAEKANSMGKRVELVVVDDDVSVGREQGGRVGRRGLAGIVLIQKILGGCVNAGADIDETMAIAREILGNLVTTSMSLTHASVPGSSGDGDQNLAADEIEIGTGIHNEPGFRKQKLQNVSQLAQTLLKQLLDQSDMDRAFTVFKPNDEVVLLINNLGGISTVEMYHLTEIVASQVEEHWGLKIRRCYTGAFVTSLDGAGASITLLNLSHISVAKEVLEYLDLPTDAPGWNSAVNSSAWARKSPEVHTQAVVRSRAYRQLSTDSQVAKSAIRGACESLITAEPEITKYDTVAGDGDAGTTLKTAAQAILAAVESGKISTTNLVDLFGDIATVLEGTMGGTGGALYTIYFAAFSSYLGTTRETSVTTALLGEAADDALGRLWVYTTARIGDKTMIDALEPFSQTLSATKSLSQAVEAAKKGALSTLGMAAMLGRATYVDASAAKTVPDAGAIGVWKLVQGLAQSLESM